MKKIVSTVAAAAMVVFCGVGLIAQADGGEKNGKPLYDTRTASISRLVPLAGEIEETLEYSSIEDECSSSTSNSENPSSAADALIEDSREGSELSPAEEESESLEEKEGSNTEDTTGNSSEENSDEESSKQEEETNSQSSSEVSSEQSDIDSSNASNSVIDNADTYDGMNFKELILIICLSAFAAGLMVFGKREEN